LQVRHHRLAAIKELAERWDWDGIELDWQRHSHHLPVAEAYRLRYVLTDFMVRALSQLHVGQLSDHGN
jgi:hypothetical protein